jgi:hypothetical protein
VNEVPETDVMDYIFPKSQKCPVCECEFMAFVVKRSKLKSLGRDRDLRTRYQGFDPNPYDVMMCSFCGYAALTAYFEQINDRQITMIQEKIAVNFTTREYHIPLSNAHALERYKMAYLCAATINAKASNKALICLKMTWICRDMDDKAGEQQYMRIALNGLKDAYSSETFPISGMDQYTAQYTIAELSRRVGDFNEAMKWISTLVTSRGAPNALKTQASEVKDLIRDGIST